MTMTMMMRMIVTMTMAMAMMMIMIKYTDKSNDDTKMFLALLNALAYPGRPYSRNKQVTPTTGGQGCRSFCLVRFRCLKI